LNSLNVLNPNSSSFTFGLRGAVAVTLIMQ
jgi:hypothetical protein